MGGGVLYHSLQHTHTHTHTLTHYSILLIALIALAAIRETVTSLPFGMEPSIRW